MEEHTSAHSDASKKSVPLGEVGNLPYSNILVNNIGHSQSMVSKLKKTKAISATASEAVATADDINIRPLTSEIINDLVTGNHTSGVVIIDVSEALEGEIYNIKARLSKTEGLKIISGNEYTSFKKVGKFEAFAKKFHGSFKAGNTVAVYDFDVFMSPGCELGKKHFQKKLSIFDVPTNNNFLHSGGVVFVTALPLDEIQDFIERAPSDFFVYKLDEEDDLDTVLPLKTPEDRLRPIIDEILDDIPRNEQTDKIIDLVKNYQAIVRKAMPKLPSEAPVLYMGKPLHGDPVVFYSVIYEAWTGFMTQSEIKHFDKKLFDAMLGKSRNDSANFEMADLFLPPVKTVKTKKDKAIAIQKRRESGKVRQKRYASKKK